MLRWLLPIVLVSLAFAPAHPRPRLHRVAVVSFDEPAVLVPVVRR